MVDLRDKIRNIIEKETQKGHFCILNLDSSVDLIFQILKNYEKTHDLKQDFSNLPKDGELVFVAAPTGAGKDTLVARLCHKNPEKKYIELNMDIFRHYFSIFIQKNNLLTDKKFAEITNEFSYEIYVTIEEILLQEFPGTNIIITGTLREIDWVEKTFEKFKQNEKTNYKVKVSCLAVPEKESAISVIKRYINIIDVKNRDDDNKIFQPGTARYTSMKYHDETYERFPVNLEYFQKKFEENPGLLIDEMEVHRRGGSNFNLDEDTQMYSSKNPNDDRTALEVVNRLRNVNYKISYHEITELVHKILENKDYLKSQDTLTEIIKDLAIILDYPEIVKKIDDLYSKAKSVEEK